MCIPLTNVSWLIWVIRLATRGGVPEVTGATPTETALLTPGKLGWVERGQVGGRPAGGQQAADLGRHDRAKDGGAEGAAELHRGGLQARVGSSCQMSLDDIMSEAEYGDACRGDCGGDHAPCGRRLARRRTCGGSC